jgi:type II secretory pathway pseudopilin PulG
MARSSGFSLVELMIVAGLTAVVLAGLGTLTLISDVQVGRRSNSLQEAQEQWGRAVTFIQNEVADAATLSVNLGNSSYPCSGDVPNPILVLKGPKYPTNDDDPAWTVIYGVRSRAAGEEGLYRGPKLLIRCGPLPLAADLNPPNRQLTAIFGNLDNNNLSATQTILLDRLPADNPLQVILLANANNGPVQDAQLTITMQAGSDSTYSGIPFRVHVQRTP